MSGFDYFDEDAHPMRRNVKHALFEYGLYHKSKR